jgi:hypothetical protein
VALCAPQPLPGNRSSQSVITVGELLGPRVRSASAPAAHDPDSLTAMSVTALLRREGRQTLLPDRRVNPRIRRTLRDLPTAPSSKKTAAGAAVAVGSFATAAVLVGQTILVPNDSHGLDGGSPSLNSPGHSGSRWLGGFLGGLLGGFGVVIGPDGQLHSVTGPSGVPLAISPASYSAQTGIVPPALRGGPAQPTAPGTPSQRTAPRAPGTSPGTVGTAVGGTGGTGVGGGPGSDVGGSAGTGGAGSGAGGAGSDPGGTGVGGSPGSDVGGSAGTGGAGSGGGGAGSDVGGSAGTGGAGSGAGGAGSDPGGTGEGGSPG